MPDSVFNPSVQSLCGTPEVIALHVIDLSIYMQSVTEQLVGSNLRFFIT